MRRQAPDPGGAGGVPTAVPRPCHVWVDGLLVPALAPVLAASDRGFQVGDGVFETIRVVAGRILELPLHMARLRASASALEIPLPRDVEARIRVAIAELLAADALVAPGLVVSVRVTVSRGPVESRALLPPDEVHPTLLVQAAPVSPPDPGLLERGLHLAISSVRRDPGSPLAAVKTTSRAEFVFARLEARRRGADDALFLTVDGHLAEATSATLFLVLRDRGNGSGGPAGPGSAFAPRASVGTEAVGVDAGVPDGSRSAPLVLATPALACGVLVGTTRQWLLRWAGQVGLSTREAWLTPDDLFGAVEVFVASSVAGVLPVTRVDGRPIGDGRPGPWTRRARSDREAFARVER